MVVRSRGWPIHAMREQLRLSVVVRATAAATTDGRRSEGRRGERAMAALVRGAHVEARGDAKRDRVSERGQSRSQYSVDIPENTAGGDAVAA